MRHFVQGTDCHFQHLACALNHSCLQLEPRFSLPVSASAICYCLSYLGRRAGLAVSATLTHIPPDSRMNPSSKHPVRLSLRRLLLPPRLVTRFTRILLRSASFHISNTPPRFLVATIPSDKASLLISSGNQFDPHLPHPLRSRPRRNQLLRTRASSTLEQPEYRQAGLYRRTELSGKCLRPTIQPPFDNGPLCPSPYFRRCCLSPGPQTSFCLLTSRSPIATEHPILSEANQTLKNIC